MAARLILTICIFSLRGVSFQIRHSPFPLPRQRRLNSNCHSSSSCTAPLEFFLFRPPTTHILIAARRRGAVLNDNLSRCRDAGRKSRGRGGAWGGGQKQLALDDQAAAEHLVYSRCLCRSISGLHLLRNLAALTQWHRLPGN